VLASSAAFASASCNLRQFQQMPPVDGAFIDE
jgi:hypothetical protein